MTSVIEAATLIHPSVKIGHFCVIERGAVIKPHCIIGDYVRVGRGCCIGEGVIIKPGVILAEDTVLKAGAFLAPSVVTLRDQKTGCGAPVICQGVFIGGGAIILPYVRIGKKATVGAGSVVLNDVPPNSTVVGVPARAMRTKVFKQSPERENRIWRGNG
ncbi:putative Serine O-acetyltransferase [uncultured Desulfobacterium sp.]|uniref:Putative Serine O-acetyltransferase n=1 Tax=uncultured Desulfobacterium sp. TaxID=201089 RepID=A0A445N1T7_9BACT|nr:putative Serine O-acetyltransferase [uncultured Desulfobacterium sp.]